MPTDTKTEERLTALEQAVAQLQQKLAKANGAQATHWLQRFRGAFKDEPAFAEVVEYGRELRAADRPAESAPP